MDSSGWNYFRALLAEYDRKPNLQLEESGFYNFFQHPRVRAVRTLNEILFLHDPERACAGKQFYLGTYPWGHWSRVASQVGGKPYGVYYDLVEGRITRDLWGYRRNPWYEPGDPYPLRIEWDQTLALYRSIKTGYRPFWNGSLPEVTLMVRRDGEMRAVRYNGQHRLAILGHLGRQELMVTAGSQSLGLVREEDVENWYYVQNKYCTPEEALSIFHAFFELNGRERIRSLGLPQMY